MIIQTLLDIKQIIKHNINQVIAVAEKDIKLKIRFKFLLIISYISPIITILMPLIIFQTLFDFKESFGPWNADNYAVFVLNTYNISLLTQIINSFPNQLRREKFWKTLPALIIAPFNRFDLLLGILLTNFILIALPFIIFFILIFIIYPISLWTILFILFIYLLIALIFSGIGLLLGVFAISKENLWMIFSFLLNLIFWASCLTYPFDLFPEVFQNIIILNPLYYIFTFLRMAWINNNVLFTIMNYFPHFLIILIASTTLPITAVYLFNKIYSRYGIVGY